MKLLKHVAPVFAAAALAAGFAGSALDEAAAQAVKTIRYTHYQPGRADQPKHAAAMAFKAYVEATSGGKIKVEIFPAGQLGNEQTVMEQLSLGSIQLAVIHEGGIAGSYKPIMVASLPFLFPDQSVAWKVFDGPFGKELGEDMAKKANARILGIADNGIRHFTNSKKPIVTPADLQGMKIRVQPSPIFVEFVKSFGASPSAISWTELTAALSQGVVDGQENGVTNILAASLFQFQKYITLDAHMYAIHAYLLSEPFWQSLSAEEKLIVQRGVDIAKGIHRGMTTFQDMNAKAILEEKGMQVTTLTPAQIAEFAKVSQGPVRAFLEKDVGKVWVDKIIAAVDEAKKN